MCSKRYFATVYAAMAVWLAPAAIAQHAGDVLVGRSAAGLLKIAGFIPDENVVVLPPVCSLICGWADNNPGFDRVVNPDPNNDLFPMQSGAQIRLEALAIDPAFRAITPSFQIIDEPGQSALLGNQNLHVHLTWHIDSDSPVFDPDKTLWRATFRLIDTGSTNYQASDPFTFFFAIVDCMTGDMNGDGFVNGDDIQEFVEVVLDPPSHSTQRRCMADIDLDGYVTPMDAAAFVEWLLGA
jgi:hypothetical protein